MSEPQFDTVQVRASWAAHPLRHPIRWWRQRRFARASSEPLAAAVKSRMEAAILSGLPLTRWQLGAVDLHALVDNLETVMVQSPEAFVRHSLVPTNRALAVSTTRGVYVLVHPDVLEALPMKPTAGHAVFGIPIVDRLPDDAHPLPQPPPGRFQGGGE